MQPRKVLKSKFSIIFVGMASVVFSLLGLAYIIRLRSALIDSTKNYKSIIVELEVKLDKSENKADRLEAKIVDLANEMISDGTYVTNGVSEGYSKQWPARRHW